MTMEPSNLTIFLPPQGDSSLGRGPIVMRKRNLCRFGQPMPGRHLSGYLRENLACRRITQYLAQEDGTYLPIECIFGHRHCFANDSPRNKHRKEVCCRTPAF